MLRAAPAAAPPWLEPKLEHPFRPFVGQLYVQALAFGLSWLLTMLGAWRLRRRHWLLSLAALAALEAVAAALASRLGAPPLSPVSWVPAAPAALLVVALAEDWNPPGHACLATTVALAALYLGYVLVVTVHAHLGPLSLLFSGLLIALQAFALLLLASSSFEILDVLCRVRWRHVAEPAPAPDFLPRVSLHVPAYNEPPEMVIETLDALARLDYPNYEVVVVDDNTADERLWRPVEAHCARLGFKFFHLENWPGYKSGALNYALSQTDPGAEIVGVVDSDYVVAPDYLRACVGLFRRPQVAFVQTPQDYREVAPDDRYAVACYHAYGYFFDVSMASRNEHNGIIFAGTMGLIRTGVLEELGGWDEWCITEDAEISLRILDRGHEGVYVHRSFGRGLMPLNFEGLKKQRFRWAFGGMQILRRHWRALLPGVPRRGPGGRLTPGQQRDYLLGALQWLNDPLTFGFTLLLLLGAWSLTVARSLFIQPLAGAVTLVPFLFIFVGVSRFLWALRVRTGCRWDQAASAFVILLGLTWVVTLACALGLVKREGTFLRTPKKRGAADPWHALRVVKYEAGLAALCLATAAVLLRAAPASPYLWAMEALLLWQGAIYASAPVSSLWGLRSELRSAHPEYLARSSRSTGNRFAGMLGDRRPAAALAAMALLLALLFVSAVRLAPEPERMFRANPEGAALIGAPLIPSSDESRVRAALFAEKQAALAGDVDAALRLWDSSGTVRDASYTESDTTDDRVWRGMDGLRLRYTREFGQRRYLELAHANQRVTFHGDTAVVENDLHALIRTAQGVQEVRVPRGDLWLLRKERDGWRIVALVVNRGRK